MNLDLSKLEKLAEGPVQKKNLSFKPKIVGIVRPIPPSIPSIITKSAAETQRPAQQTAVQQAPSKPQPLFAATASQPTVASSKAAPSAQQPINNASSNTQPFNTQPKGVKRSRKQAQPTAAAAETPGDLDIDYLYNRDSVGVGHKKRGRPRKEHDLDGDANGNARGVRSGPQGGLTTEASQAVAEAKATGKLSLNAGKRRPVRSRGISKETYMDDGFAPDEKIDVEQIKRRSKVQHLPSNTVNNKDNDNIKHSFLPTKTTPKTNKRTKILERSSHDTASLEQQQQQQNNRYNNKSSSTVSGGAVTRKREAKAQNTSKTQQKQRKSAAKALIKAKSEDAEGAKSADSRRGRLADLELDTKNWTLRHIVSWANSNDRKRAKEEEEELKNNDGEGGGGGGSLQVPIPGGNTQNTGDNNTQPPSQQANVSNTAMTIHTINPNLPPRQTSVAPQVQVVDGRLVVNRQSLTVQAQERHQYTRVVNEDSRVNSISYTNRISNERWSVEDTELFYKALSQFGTDFSLITNLFPGRQRRHIKNKFTRESKINTARVNEAMRMSATSGTINSYKDMITMLKESGMDGTGGPASIPETIAGATAVVDDGKSNTAPLTITEAGEPPSSVVRAPPQRAGGSGVPSQKQEQLEGEQLQQQKQSSGRKASTSTLKRGTRQR